MRAILNRSSRNLASSPLLSTADASSASRAALRARRHPSAIVWGWIRWLMRSSASRLGKQRVGQLDTELKSVRKQNKSAALVAPSSIITHSNSPHKTATLVVPSPTSSSWTLEISTKTFAAALSRLIDFKIVAPSFVTLML